MILRCLGWRKRKRDDHTLVRRRTCQDSLQEHIYRGDGAETEDIVAETRGTFEGGASATEGDVWGAGWE